MDLGTFASGDLGAAVEHGLLVLGDRGLDVIGVRSEGLAEFGAVG
ncbi:hypothetical protein ABZ478_35015 [Streptomyces sp. NPDC005706]